MADLLTKYDGVPRFAAAWLCCAFLLLPCSALFAQSSDLCPQALSEAETQYIEGRFDDVLSTLSDCITRDDVLVTDAVAAYRLIALAHIRKGEVEEARLSVIELLNRMPEYEPDPIRDIPSYVALVNLAKQELQIETATTPSTEEAAIATEERRRSWFQSNRVWLIAGGSAALVGVITAVAVGGGGGGGDGGSATLPAPPVLPN